MPPYKSTLELSCLIVKPSSYTRKTWSPTYYELVMQCRCAHRQAARFTSAGDRREEKELRNKIKKQIRQDSNHAWRDFVQEASHKPLNKGTIWQLAKWARKSAGKPKSPPSYPLLGRQNMTTQQQTSSRRQRFYRVDSSPPSLHRPLRHRGSPGRAIPGQI